MMPASTKSPSRASGSGRNNSLASAVSPGKRNVVSKAAYDDNVNDNISEPVSVNSMNMFAPRAVSNDMHDSMNMFTPVSPDKRDVVSKAAPANKGHDDIPEPVSAKSVASVSSAGKRGASVRVAHDNHDDDSSTRTASANSATGKGRKKAGSKTSTAKVIKHGPARGLVAPAQGALSRGARTRRAPVRFGIDEHVEGRSRYKLVDQLGSQGRRRMVKTWIHQAAKK